MRIIHKQFLEHKTCKKTKITHKQLKHVEIFADSLAHNNTNNIKVLSTVIYKFLIPVSKYSNSMAHRALLCKIKQK